MRSNSKMRIYDKLQKEFDLILKHKDTGQCLKTLNAYRRIPKHWSRIVKIENAEAKRAQSFLKKNKELAEKVKNMPVMSSVGFGTMKECERLRHYIYTIHGKGCSVTRTIPSSDNKVEYRIWRVR